MDDFAARGFETHAISLRGHGQSSKPPLFHLSGLHDYVEDLAYTISTIQPTPIVIGHSMGGYITQLYLMEHTLPGAILLCSIPVNGILPFLLNTLRSAPLTTMSALPRLFSGPFDARHAICTFLFRSDIDPVLLDRYSTRLNAESLRIGVESSLYLFPQPERNRSPLLIIAAENDRMFTLDEQQEIADAYRSPLVIIPEAPHDIMLDPAWSHAAHVIEQTIAEWTIEPTIALTG